MPLITRRSSTRALPRVSVGRCGLIFENCAFVSQNWSRLIYASFSEAVNHATTFVPTLLWVQTLSRLFPISPRPASWREDRHDSHVAAAALRAYEPTLLGRRSCRSRASVSRTSSPPDGRSRDNGPRGSSRRRLCSATLSLRLATGPSFSRAKSLIGELTV